MQNTRESRANRFSCRFLVASRFGVRPARGVACCRLRKHQISRRGLQQRVRREVRPLLRTGVKHAEDQPLAAELDGRGVVVDLCRPSASAVVTHRQAGNRFCCGMGCLTALIPGSSTRRSRDCRTSSPTMAMTCGLATACVAAWV